MAQGRINLCFDTDIKSQKMVYEYLKSLGRKKTRVVTDLIMMSARIAKESEQNKQAIDEKTARVIADYVSDSVEKIANQYTASILKQIERIQLQTAIIPSTATDDTEPQNLSEPDDGISDIDMMALEAFNGLYASE